MMHRWESHNTQISSKIVQLRIYWDTDKRTVIWRQRIAIETETGDCGLETKNCMLLFLFKGIEERERERERERGFEQEYYNKNHT